jgi:hypothetical protein
MSMIGFPLLLIPLAICNIIIFLMPGVEFGAPVATLKLWSGTNWPLTLGDTLLALGALLLLLEVIKGARPHGKFFTDHLLALLTFGGAVAEFVGLPQFGNSTFFLLTVLALVDVLSGLALRSRTPPRRAAKPAPVAAVPAPPIEPAPEVVAVAAPALPAAASIAEAVLMDRPEPMIAAASPQIASPNLQPHNGTDSDKPS